MEQVGLLFEKLCSSASPGILYILNPVSLLLCLQEPTSCQYPEPDQSNLSFPILFKVLFNIILPSTSRYSKVSLYFKCSSKTLYEFLVSYVTHALPISFPLVCLLNQTISAVSRPCKVFHSKLISYSMELLALSNP
jgi:hypothetical protein